MEPVILIVDDDEAILTVTQAILEDAGYTVLVSSDSYGGFLDALAHRPSLILLDVRMPVLSGADFLRMLRMQEEYYDTKVILFSASAALPRLAGEAKPDAVLAKPFHIDELLSLVETLLAPTEEREAVLL